MYQFIRLCRAIFISEEIKSFYDKMSVEALLHQIELILLPEK